MIDYDAVDYNKHFQGMIDKEMERFYMALDNGAREEIRKIVREELAAAATRPMADEPEYGWGSLAKDLNIKVHRGWDHGPEFDRDTLRGTCVRLMRETGWICLTVDHWEDTNNWYWAYGKDMGSDSDVGMTAPSEPAAYRDMLKHAGVLK